MQSATEPLKPNNEALHQEIVKEQACDRSIDIANKFWELIEKQMGCMIPMYLKNILRLRGFENAASIKTLTGDDYKDLQTFAQTKMAKFIPSGARLDDYYYIFWKEPDTFEILPGHVRLLDEIVKHINMHTSIRGPAFCDPNSKFGKENRNQVRQPARRTQMKGQ